MPCVYSWLNTSIWFTMKTYNSYLLCFLQYGTFLSWHFSWFATALISPVLIQCKSGEVSQDALENKLHPTAYAHTHPWMQTRRKNVHTPAHTFINAHAKPFPAALPSFPQESTKALNMSTHKRTPPLSIVSHAHTVYLWTMILLWSLTLLLSSPLMCLGLMHVLVIQVNAFACGAHFHSGSHCTHGPFPNCWAILFTHADVFKCKCSHSTGNEPHNLQSHVSYCGSLSPCIHLAFMHFYCSQDRFQCCRPKSLGKKKKITTDIYCLSPK